jgi:hypothetical protein
MLEGRDEGRRRIWEGGLVDERHGPRVRRGLDHSVGLLGGIGDFDADVGKEPAQADGDEFDLFGVLVDEKDGYGFALRHPTGIQRKHGSRAREVSIPRLDKSDGTVPGVGRRLSAARVGMCLT